MADQNGNDNVVYNNLGSARPDQPVSPYSMQQPDYNINPDGYAGYTNYITGRGDDSKYGSVPRFDSLPYDQFQPLSPYGGPSGYGYGAPSGYGYNNSMPYPTGFDPGYMPGGGSQLPGYPQPLQYPADNYGPYGSQAYDWQQMSGQFPSVQQQMSGQFPPVQQGAMPNPFTAQHMTMTGQFPVQQKTATQFPPMQQGYNVPRAPGYPQQMPFDQYSQPSRSGIGAPDVIDDILGNPSQGYPPQQADSAYAKPQSFPPYGYTGPFQNEAPTGQFSVSAQNENQPMLFGVSEQSENQAGPFAFSPHGNTLPHQFSPQPPPVQPAQYQPGDSFTPDYSAASPFTFDTAVFSLSDIQRQQANSQPSAVEKSQQFPPYQQPEQTVFQQPEQAIFQQPEQTVFQQPEQTIFQQYEQPRQPAAFQLPEQPQMQPPFQPNPPEGAAPQETSSFEQSFGVAFASQQLEKQSAAPVSQPFNTPTAFSPASSAGQPPFMGSFPIPPQPAAAEAMASPLSPVSSDSEMDNLFGAVFDPAAAPQQPPVFEPAVAAVNEPEQSEPVIDSVFANFRRPAPAAQPFGNAPANVQQNNMAFPAPQAFPAAPIYPAAPPAAPPPTDVDSSTAATAAETTDNVANQASLMRGTEIFRIAEELSQAVLVKSHSRAFNDNNLMKEDHVRLVQIDGITSDYYISEGGGKPYRMFEDVSFGINSGCCCALISEVPLASYVLSRSICESADQDYDDEPVKVADTPDGEPGQIMYIGSDSMLPDEMTCEDFLLYTQTGSDDNDEAESEKLGVLLSQLGMSSMQDTDLRELSYNKRILLITLAAALNPNIVCIVINDPKFRVDAEEEMLARRIFSLINNRGKCSIIACSSAYLMASVVNRVAVIKRGQLVFYDEYKKFVDDYCLGIMSFNSDKPQEIASQIEAKYSNVTVLCKENLVYLIKTKDSPDIDLEALIKDVISFGADYNSMVMDEKSFVMACKEALGK